MKTNADPLVNCFSPVHVAWFGFPNLTHFTFLTLRNLLIARRCPLLHVNQKFFTELASAKTSRHHFFPILHAVMHIIVQLHAANVNAINRAKLFICCSLRSFSFANLKINCADDSPLPAADVFPRPSFRHFAFCILHFPQKPRHFASFAKFPQSTFREMLSFGSSCHRALPNLRSAFRSLPVI